MQLADVPLFDSARTFPSRVRLRTAGDHGISQLGMAVYASLDALFLGAVPGGDTCLQRVLP